MLNIQLYVSKTHFCTRYKNSSIVQIAEVIHPIFVRIAGVILIADRPSRLSGLRSKKTFMDSNYDNGCNCELTTL